MQFHQKIHFPVVYPIFKILAASFDTVLTTPVLKGTQRSTCELVSDKIILLFPWLLRNWGSTCYTTDNATKQEVSEFTQSSCAFVQEKQLNLIVSDYLTVDTRWLFNNGLSFFYTETNTCSKQIPQLRLLSHHCCSEPPGSGSVVSTTRQQSRTVTKHTALHGVIFTLCFKRCSSTPFSQEQEMLFGFFCCF